MVARGIATDISVKMKKLFAADPEDFPTAGFAHMPQWRTVVYAQRAAMANAAPSKRYTERQTMVTRQERHMHETMHALRQPLNALRLTLANLRHRVSADGNQLDIAQAQAKLGMMDVQIQRMADLIDTMLVTEERSDR